MLAELIEQAQVWWENDLFKAAAILTLSICLALVVRLMMAGLFNRLAKRTRTDIDDKILAACKNPITITIILGGVDISLRTVLPDAFPLLAKTAIHRMLVSVVVLVWFIAFMDLCNYFADWLSEREDKISIVQPRTKPLFRILFKLVIVLAAAYFLILSWNLNVAGWLASAGVAGIAIGFAAKDTLANLFAGVFIIADAPYKIGDYIVLGNGDRGRVTDIGIRSTRLLTRDDVEVIIPNAIIGNTEIINQSGGPYEKFRLRVPVGVAYGSDLDQVRQILMDAAISEKLVEAEPEPRVRLRAYGNSSLDHELLVWVATPELRGMALDNLLTDIYKTFRKLGVEIPYPKRDVYLHRVDEALEDGD